MAMDGLAPTKLELSVLAAIALADRERLTMERQVQSLRPIKREITGVGFFTAFDLPDDIALLDKGRWKIEDMGHGFAHHPALPAGASFILWIREGKIAQLEGCTNGGDWPTDEASFRVAI